MKGDKFGIKSKRTESGENANRTKVEKATHTKKWMRPSNVFMILVAFVLIYSVISLMMPAIQ